MRSVIPNRAIFAAFVLCTVWTGIAVHAQDAARRPRIGVALYGGVGASSASAIGFLQALDERNIPVDVISGSGAATFVAALYATGHTPEEMEKAFEEYKDAFVDTYLKSDVNSAYYPSDFKIQRFLAQRFAKFDLNLGVSSSPPIPLLTSAMDLSSGEFVHLRLRIAEAVRLSFASPIFLQPVQVGDRLLIGDASGQVAALRRSGADVVIAYFDASFDFNKRDAQHPTNLKDLVTQSALDAHERGAILEDLKHANVVISARGDAFVSEYDMMRSLVRMGYDAFQQKAPSLLVFATTSNEAGQRRNALNAFYKDPAITLDRLTIDSIEVKGNRYVDTSSILKILNLKAKGAFDLDFVLSSLDKLYGTGYLSRCSFAFERPKEGVVRIVLDVKESEFLPLESLPKLEAAIKVNKRIDVDEDDDDDSDSKKSTAANASKADDDEDDDSDDADSLFAATAIGNLGPSAKHAIPKLASLLQDKSPVIQTAAVMALGAMGRDAKSQLCNLVGFLTLEDSNQRREAGHAIARISAPLFSEQDLDALDPLESAAAILDKDPRLAEYANSVHVSLSVLRNVQASVLANRADEYSVSELEAGSPLSNSAEVLLNGVRVKLDVTVDQSHVQFLGPEAKGAIHQGINRVVKGKEDFLFWMEERKLTAYQNPYRNSYAVVVAIDDYDRKKDAHYGGPTGYHALSGMVASARTLTDVLVELGFPKKNIITLYDEQATSASVQNVLASFWPGGANASADRLFFYFGGHGDKYSDNPADKGRTIPYLVTYDFDQKKPTQTALLMRDLADRDSQNILARHVIFALDACDSGLTLGGLGSAEAVDQRVRRFQALSLIRRDTENVARNLLVAGTGDQQALWQNGGLFTRALIEGLRGGADLNNDGVIQFEELGVYVRNRVTAQAAETQVRQDPEFRVLDQYGSGRILFVK